MILVIGEILFDLFPNYKRLGGAPFNFAYHLRNFGFDVRFVSRIGIDGPGREILYELELARFNLDDIQVDEDHPTGGVQFDEPFGLSVIESMACSTPVIAFDRGSMPELIENSKTGFLVNNETEAIETVARIKEINRAYCRRHAERHFTVDRMVNE